MKSLRKAMALLLAMVMVLAMGISVFAAETGTITITPPAGTTGENTYKVYKVFDAVGNGTNISYKLVAGKSTAPTGFAVDEAGNVTYAGLATGTELTADDIAAIADYVKEDVPVATVKTTGTTPAVTGDLPNGYYYITTTTGSIVTIDSTNPSAVVNDKNENPTITKEVQEDRDESWGKKNDADIGQVVNYKTTVTLKKGAVKNVVHDKMTAGLTFNDDVAIKGLTAGTDYTVTAPAADGDTFDIAFSKSYLDSITEDTTLVITYSATLNENAVVNLPTDPEKGNGNDNDTYLTWGEENNNESEHDWTRTYTWDVNIFKYTMDGQTAKALDGAKFTFANAAGTLAFTKVNDNVYKLDANGTITEFTTDTTGKFQIIGLDEGVYTLTEIEAPEGYNKLEAPITVTISSNGIKDEQTTTQLTAQATYTPSGNKSGGTAVDVENNGGSTLPSTGGIGTTIFYIVGGIIVAGAAILLIAKRKVNG